MAAAAEHLAADRLAQTVAALTPVLQARAGHPEALRMLGIVLHKSGQYDDAVDAYRQALQSAPDDALLWNNLGSAQRARGDGEGAEDAFRRAVALAPELTAAWYNLGKMYKTQGRLELARPALERALQLDAGHVPARVTFGETLRSLGQVDAAVAAFEQAIRDEPAAGGAWYALADLKTYHFDADQAQRLQRLLGDVDLGDEQRIFLGFAAAKALDDLGRYDEAYAALVQANRLKRAGFADWNPDALERHYDQIGVAFETPPPSPLDAQLGAEAVFVVSLPRSGSTLTEQILAAHSQVDAAGEMPDLAQVIDAESARRFRTGPPRPMRRTGTVSAATISRARRAGAAARRISPTRAWPTGRWSVRYGACCRPRASSIAGAIRSRIVCPASVSCSRRATNTPTTSTISRSSGAATIA